MYLEQCRIAVVSAIFGDWDHLRLPQRSKVRLREGVLDLYGCDDRKRGVSEGIGRGQDASVKGLDEDNLFSYGKRQGGVLVAFSKRFNQFLSPYSPPQISVAAMRKACFVIFVDEQTVRGLYRDNLIPSGHQGKISVAAKRRACFVIFVDEQRVRGLYRDNLIPDANGKTKRKACFVIFVDEQTVRGLYRDNLIPDANGKVGLWRVVVVANLPYSDARRTGKIPKLLSHRLFPNAKYSMWIDSKLRLFVDPLTILERFLWRGGFEYAISNHYDRHCVWEEVERNKKLNKYNATVIDKQFEAYKADGLTMFNPNDPNNLLISNVPEGSVIIRAHTAAANLFSCLWFNEVDRFTSRDQLSFAYTYLKMARTSHPLRLNMFKDCERRSFVKLFHHKAEEAALKLERGRAR
ncbi:unnamed protein product [Closterium sp. Yama58-4]|nr:unnamed protein product [Closterium sp. Yama58-4]